MQKKGEGEKKEATNKPKQGKKNRASGARFELKVRAALEKERWILDKWSNNVDLIKGEIVKSKRKYNPFLKFLSIGTGFPDFIGFRRADSNYEVIGVEVKANGWLDRSEKEKCLWYLKNKIFSKILIAKKSKKRGNIDYIDFNDKYIQE
jgi:hypothetical protein